VADDGARRPFSGERRVSILTYPMEHDGRLT